MKTQKRSVDHYILLPIFQTRISPIDSPSVAEFLQKLHIQDKKPAVISLSAKNMPAESAISLEVLDSIDTVGAKLIRIDNDELPTFRFSYPGLRIIRERFYRPALNTRANIKIQSKNSRLSSPVSIQVTDHKDQCIEGVTVVVFTDFTIGKGASGITDSKGMVNLKLSGTDAEYIYIYPEHSYWGYFNKNVPFSDKINIRLQPISLSYKDALRYFYNNDNLSPISQKVKIGIIDTGVGPHKDLKIAGGKNMVRGEDETDYFDNGEGHGTHVAGIIAASGQINGVANGVEIMSYRVFPKNQGASNFDIMKAINQAIIDECDLINLSLGEAQDDEAISSYISEAYHAGILCFAANGNDNRGPVSFPAAHSLSIAVSAMGRKGTFPANSVESGTIKEPFGTDQNNFIANFSNVGPETDLTAPGVGILSTYPNDRYAIMDGTSMACPAAAGIAARILSKNPQVLNLPRNQTRADEMIKTLSINIKLLGFGANFEGKGMLYCNDELHS